MEYCKHSYSIGHNEMILSLIAALAVMIAGIMSANIIYMLMGLILMIFSAVVKNRPYWFYMGMIAAPFFLEMVYFTILGGTFRIGFLCSCVIIFLWIKNLTEIMTAPNMRSLTIMFIYFLVTAFLSSYMSGAFKSTLFLILNAAIGYAVCILLVNEYFLLEEFEEILRIILFVCIAFGLIQYLIYRFSGIGIGFNTLQAQQQLAMGQIPGFRTEANTHGKLVCWTIIFCLPPIINCSKNAKQYKFLLVLSILTLALSMTRSASYGMIITIIVMLIWYTLQGRSNNSMRIILLGLVAVGVILVIISSGILGDSSYSLYKLQNMFITNVDEVKSDGSGSFRFDSFIAAYEIWNQSIKTRLFGVGYGQAWATIKGLATETRAGGNDIMSVLAGGGIIGEILFIWTNIRTWKAAAIATKGEHNIFAEQMMFCAIYGFMICFFSGILQCPEYWISLGCIAALWYNNRRNYI